MRWNMIPGNWNLIQQEDSLVTNKNMAWSQKWGGLKQTNRERFTRKHEKHKGFTIFHHSSFESAEVQPESVLEISISKIGRSTVEKCDLSRAGIYFNQNRHFKDQHKCVNWSTHGEFWSATMWIGKSTKMKTRRQTGTIGISPAMGTLIAWFRGDRFWVYRVNLCPAWCHKEIDQNTHFSSSTCCL